MNFILGIILGGAIIVVIYESYYEKEAEKASKLLASNLEKLIEVSSMEISKQRRDKKRDLTEDEKNTILKECYNKVC